LIQPSDKDPLDIVLRRTHSLLEFYQAKTRIPAVTSEV